MPLNPGTVCECGCNRIQHRGDRGACCGYRCHCTRFVTLTRQTVHVRMMRDALSVAIDVIYDLPGEGRTIKVGLPDKEEKASLIAKMKAAIAGPKAVA